MQDLVEWHVTEYTHGQACSLADIRHEYLNPVVDVVPLLAEGQRRGKIDPELLATVKQASEKKR